MIKVLLIAITLVSVIIIGYSVVDYVDKSEEVEEAITEAEEQQEELQQKLVECRNTLINAGMNPMACDRRAEQAQQQIIESLN